MRLQVVEALAFDARECRRKGGGDYAAIARRMNVLGAPTSAARLTSLLAPTKQTKNLPLADAAAFCRATGERAGLRLVCRAAGLDVDDEPVVRLGRAAAELERARAAYATAVAAVEPLSRSAVEPEASE